MAQEPGWLVEGGRERDGGGCGRRGIGREGVRAEETEREVEGGRGREVRVGDGRVGGGERGGGKGEVRGIGREGEKRGVVERG